MTSSHPPPRGPAVTIILPTYNRGRFLPQAFASIENQTFDDWDLVVVDDGSTDDTRAVVEGLPAGVRARLSYTFRVNGGAYAARNTGLDLARGRAVAFFDSDDEWLPHHLADCWRALEQAPDVHWVYAASRIVDDASGRVLTPSTFYARDRPRPFLRLPAERRGDELRVFSGADLISTTLAGAGLYCGLQNSVIRREVFERLRFRADARNEAEDRAFLIRALASGFRLGYIDKVHHVYHVHTGNSSGAAIGMPLEKQVRIYTDLIRGFEELPDLVPLTRRQRRALERKLADQYFWHLGYATYWKAGLRHEALAAYRQGLRLAPFRLPYWKTYLLARLRTGGAPRRR